MKVVCPSCGKGYRVPEEFNGTQIRCRGCGGAIVVPLDPLADFLAKPYQPPAVRRDDPMSHYWRTAVRLDAPPPVSEAGQAPPHGEDAPLHSGGVATRRGITAWFRSKLRGTPPAAAKQPENPPSGDSSRDGDR